jgi:hypothetical protein
MLDKLFKLIGSKSKEATPKQKYGRDRNSYSIGHLHVRVVDLLNSDANRIYASMSPAEIQRLFFDGMHPPDEDITGNVIIITSIGVVDGHNKVLKSKAKLLPVIIFEARNAFEYLDDDYHPRGNDGKPNPDGLISLWMHCPDWPRADLEPMTGSVVQVTPKPERQLPGPTLRRQLPPSEKK